MNGRCFRCRVKKFGLEPNLDPPPPPPLFLPLTSPSLPSWIVFIFKQRGIKPPAIKSTAPHPGFKIDPRSYVACVDNNEALNFPVVCSRKNGHHRLLSTIVWGKPEISSFHPPFSLSLRGSQEATNHRLHRPTPPAAFQHIYFQGKKIENATYLKRFLHAGIFSLSTFFPLRRSSRDHAYYTVRLRPPPHRGGWEWGFDISCSSVSKTSLF